MAAIKFRQVSLLFTIKDSSQYIKKKVYRSHVRTCMLHSETWLRRKESELALQTADMRPVRWMYEVKMNNRSSCVHCGIQTQAKNGWIIMDDIITVLQHNLCRQG